MHGIIELSSDTRKCFSGSRFDMEIVWVLVLLLVVSLLSPIIKRAANDLERDRFRDFEANAREDELRDPGSND